MKAIRYILLIVCVIVALLPFYWMVTTAFSGKVWISDPQLLPLPLYWGAFEKVLISHPFLRWTMNTTIVSVAGTSGTIFFSSLAGFSFACLRFKYRDLIFYILLSTMILPGFLMVIPKFFFIFKVGGINTYWGIFIPTWFSMFSVFFLRQHYFSIPYGILNAARVDGANLWQIYWRLVLPHGKNIIMALFVINFIGNWNSFLWPLVIIRRPEMKTLTLGMSEFYGMYFAEYNNIMAGAVISMIPLMIIFLLFNKYIEKGLGMRITF